MPDDVSPVVLLHGAASAPRTWDGLRAKLGARGIKSHALVLLGHGGRPRPNSYPLGAFAEDALAQLADLRITSCTLIGHSLGAYTATLIGEQRPDLVKLLVLEEPPVPPSNPGDGRPFTRASQARMWLLSPAVRRRMAPRALRQALTQLTHPQPLWWDNLDRIGCRTLVVGGGSRSHVDQGRLRLLADRLPDAAFESIRAGHRVHSTQPEAFDELALTFLTGGTRP